MVCAQDVDLSVSKPILDLFVEADPAQITFEMREPVCLDRIDIGHSVAYFSRRQGVSTALAGMFGGDTAECGQNAQKRQCLADSGSGTGNTAHAAHV